MMRKSSREVSSLHWKTLLSSSLMNPAWNESRRIFTWPDRCSWLRQSTSSWRWGPAHSPDWRQSHEKKKTLISLQELIQTLAPTSDKIKHNIILDISFLVIYSSKHFAGIFYMLIKTSVILGYTDLRLPMTLGSLCRVPTSAASPISTSCKVTGRKWCEMTNQEAESQNHSISHPNKKKTQSPFTSSLASLSSICPVSKEHLQWWLGCEPTLTWNQASCVQRRMSQAVIRSTPAKEKIQSTPRHIFSHRVPPNLHL